MKNKRDKTQSRDMVFSLVGANRIRPLGETTNDIVRANCYSPLHEKRTTLLVGANAIRPYDETV